MSSLKHFRVAKLCLVIINFLAVLFYSSVYLFGTKYIIEHGLSHSLLEQITNIPASPEQSFWMSNLTFLVLLLVIYLRGHVFEKSESALVELGLVEVALLLATFFFLQFSYNGLVLLVFMDLFFSYTNFYSFHRKRTWLLFVVASFGILLLSDYDILSLLIPTPSLEVYINFFPQGIRNLILLLKNFLVSLNIIVFLISLVTYIMYSVTENHKIEEELLLASQANLRLKEYVAVSEKITEDRERKRIAREIHDTIGHALTGISAGIDAVTVLIDLNPDHAKKQLSNVSKAVREGIVDVRRSLNKLRPGALENQSLKDALEKMIAEYQELSQMQIELDYQLEGIDLEKTKESILFRVIQESITNALRHGQASNMRISMKKMENFYQLTIHDNGLGCANIKPGFGLKQMQERLAIIGGQVRFSGKDGFLIEAFIPKLEGEEV